ncbi:MAG TPA: hypothetical protein VFS59_02555, partial [Gemmatimonadaceae bacterium]|nr:hypothetical protein [Gemmatimonadaceae bacterium]
MVRRRLLLTASLAVALLGAQPALAHTPSNCSTTQAALGQCDVQVSPETTDEGTTLEGVIEAI